MVFYLPDLRRDNIALYTIPAFWAISIYPRIFALKLFEAETSEKFDTRVPRDFQGKVAANTKLDESKRGRIRRAEAACANGFENFGLFAAAVTAGSFAGLDPLTLNGLTLGYLVSRIFYNRYYIAAETAGIAKVRTAAYMGGLALLFTIFIKAAQKLNKLNA
ncbi:uncharacterized protein MYCFIDRAFT_168884 [Pseudocercospora fijiensis CIRAD86]|uniref:Uncharacterized protein n=1 Tax=Pseudocercospora fijiensis (strain CIRAD86) TaxID=383855 RepID=M3AH68_PSEFD|nr:uncharacterized protein MYCFIDRAFT_168884 [Pseudocercospora fijiensis CIRAD86]EME76842.1 hypothetical protein MYCFIDRAFT_168884 [Pseudocercospora fijiensis CIRAD86]